MLIAKIGGLLLLGFGLFLLVTALLRFLRGLLSMGWPVVEGTVSKAVVDEEMLLESSNNYRALIHARYTVAGRDYDAHIADAQNANIYSKRAARRAVKQYAVGKPIKLRVNPAKPEQAVLSSLAFVLHAIVQSIGGAIVLALGAYIAYWAFLQS